MKIAFVSVRGIPNNYGGFEQFAEYISVGLVKRGHEVTVYSPSYHPYKDDEYKGVKIKHIYSPETWMDRNISVPSLTNGCASLCSGRREWQ